jgi:uncharacterized BrkB/YihY/UPF0761 family membrane protein
VRRENKMQGRKVLVLFKTSFVIAVIIFFTAILYDFSLKMYYSSTNQFVQIGSSLLAIIVMTLIIMLFLWWIPNARKAVLRMFGLDEESKKEKSN